MFVNNKDRSKPDMDLKIARKQVSEYAMALDLLAKLTHSGTENETVENILELFTVLFSPKKLFYVSLRDGQPEKIFSSSLSVEDHTAIKNRVPSSLKNMPGRSQRKAFW